MRKVINQISPGRFHAQVEHNGVIGHAIKSTPEAAFMAAAVERHHTDRAFMLFCDGLNRSSLLWDSFPIIVEA